MLNIYARGIGEAPGYVALAGPNSEPLVSPGMLF